MKAYVVTKNGVTLNESFTTLKAACKAAGVVYSTARKGRKHFIINDEVISITKTEVIRNKK